MSLTLGGSDWDIFLLDARFLLELNISLMFANKLGAKFHSVVLMPKLLKVFASLLAIYFCLNGLTCLLVHLCYLRADYLINMVCRQLIN